MEDAERQRVIVRQNVLSRAVEMRIAGLIDDNDVINLAERFERWVLGKSDQKQQISNEGETCTKCGQKNVPEKVVKYSMDKFNKVFCYNCQNEIRNNS